MTLPGKFPLRPVIYGLVMVYLICDLYWCGGPLSRRIKKTDPHSPVVMVTADPIVARVSAYNIHRSQLERAVVERLRSEGKTLAELNPAERSRVRHAALDDLIDHELLRTKAGAQASNLKVSDDEITERLNRFRARFSNNKELAAAMASQGIGSEQDLRERLAARIQQEKFVEGCIAPLVKVTQEEARQWFEQNQQRLTTPARVNARHIFIPTLERDSDAAQQPLVTALAALTEKTADFAMLARQLSEDPLTKDGGGELGWMTRERLPADLAEPLFSLPLNQPNLVRSKLGWHLIEVTARRPAEPRSFAQALPEILTAMETVKRQQAASEVHDSLRQGEASHIEIYRERVDNE